MTHPSPQLLADFISAHEQDARLSSQDLQRADSVRTLIDSLRNTLTVFSAAAELLSGNSLGQVNALELGQVMRRQIQALVVQIGGLEQIYATGRGSR